VRTSLPSTALLLLTGFALSPVQAQQHVIQIGGGDSLDSSQGQIEANVIWLNELFSSRDNTLHNFFASGSGIEKDVIYLDPQAAPSRMEGLKRIFDNALSDRSVTRHNSVPASGSTAKDTLTPALKQLMLTIKPGDETLIVYNGHGGLNPSDTANNYLRTWGKTRITVEDFDQILDKAPKDTTIRFVFPQCFSGAFHNLIYQNPWSHELAEQNRCGFLAQSPFNESEGCTLSVNAREYNDYSTYFFAAVAGQTRTHKLLASNPDLNHDNKLSYREAHLYVLLNSTSKDLARSTSEVFLEHWQPWYLKWLPTKENNGSFYWQAAETIARRNQFEMNSASLHRQYRELTKQFMSYKTQNRTLGKEVEVLQKQLQQDLQACWPDLSKGVVLSGRLPDEKLDAINAYLAQKTEYQTLKNIQEQFLETTAQTNEAERRIAQIDKILRFMKLARLERQFEHYASSADKARYSRLLTCESSFLNE
jgi:hypothetical protein